MGDSVKSRGVFGRESISAANWSSCHLMRGAPTGQAKWPAPFWALRARPAGAEWAKGRLLGRSLGRKRGQARRNKLSAARGSLIYVSFVALSENKQKLERETNACGSILARLRANRINRACICWRLYLRLQLAQSEWAGALAA